MNDLKELLSRITSAFEEVKQREFSFSDPGQTESFTDVQNKILLEQTNGQPPEIIERLKQECFGFGPLESLFADPSASEILVINAETIWIERGGQLHRHPDHFLSEVSYLQIIERLCQQAGAFVNLEKPFASGKFRNFRFGIVHSCLTMGCHQISLRRHPENPWTLDSLMKAGWCDERSALALRELIAQKRNFLILGSTGSGKTSLANALLQETAANDRSILIEDTPELHLPNSCSLRLLTREAVDSSLTEVNQQDLLKKALRLRPDRLVMGEMRSSEAKDFLMMIATGHRGCFGTIHAHSPQQSLMRLEMLVQMGAPQWSLQTVRRLIHQSLDAILVAKKDESGQRRFGGIFRIQSLEEFGFTIEQEA